MGQLEHYNSHVAQRDLVLFCPRNGLCWIGLIRITFLCSLNNKYLNEVSAERNIGVNSPLYHYECKCRNVGLNLGRKEREENTEKFL